MDYFQALQVIARRRAGGGVPGPFSPADLSGLLAWYDANNAPSITQSGDDLTQWADLSGNGNHLTQSAGANAPHTGTATVNSLNAIDFDGVSQRIDRSDALGLTGNPNLWVWMVVDLDVSSGAARRFFSLGDSTDSTAGELVQFDEDGYYRFNDGNQQFSAVATGSTVSILVQRTSGSGYGDGLAYYNNVSQSETSSSNPLSTPSLTNQYFVVGAGVASVGTLETFLDGRICEMAVGSAVLTTGERDDLHTYASSKWIP